MTDYKSKIFDAAREVLPDLDPADVTAADAFCDYCVPCFKFAKLLRKSPAAIASEAAAALNADGMTVSALNGYLNFKIDKAGLAKSTLAQIEEEGDFYGASR